MLLYETLTIPPPQALALSEEEAKAAKDNLKAASRRFITAQAELMMAAAATPAPGPRPCPARAVGAAEGGPENASPAAGAGAAPRAALEASPVVASLEGKFSAPRSLPAPQAISLCCSWPLSPKP